MSDLDPILLAQLDPMSLPVLEVGHTLDAICDCNADMDGHEATDPQVRSVRLPHHYDCAAVNAWPAFQAALAAVTANDPEVTHEVAALWGSAENGIYTLGARLSFALAALTKISTLVPGWDDGE